MHPSTAAYLARFPDDPEAPRKDAGGADGWNVVASWLGRGRPNAVTRPRRGCFLPELPRLTAKEFRQGARRLCPSVTKDCAEINAPVYPGGAPGTYTVTVGSRVGWWVCPCRSSERYSHGSCGDRGD
jgi:hypothetical protein